MKIKTQVLCLFITLVNEANQIYKKYTLDRNDKEKDYAIIAFMRKFAEDPKG